MPTPTTQDRGSGNIPIGAQQPYDSNGNPVDPGYTGDGGNVTLGAKADTVASSDTGTFSVVAFIKRGLQNWTTLLAKIPALVSGRIPVDPSGVTSPTAPGKYQVVPVTLPDGTVTFLLVDVNGRLVVSLGTAIAGENLTLDVLGVMHKPSVSTTYGWTRFWSAGTVTYVVKASPGNLRSYFGVNRNAATRYLQLHNLTAAPAGSAVPVFSWPVAAGGNVIVEASFIGEAGDPFTTGITLAWSTAEGIYTAATAAEHSVGGYFV